jgi:hypothetical protein
MYVFALFACAFTVSLCTSHRIHRRAEDSSGNFRLVVTVDLFLVLPRICREFVAGERMEKQRLRERERKRMHAYCLHAYVRVYISTHCLGNCCMHIFIICMYVYINRYTVQCVGVSLHSCANAYAHRCMCA